MSSTGAIHVIGHKNPDTDSICSAVAYSYLKSKISDNSYIPCRAGNVNPETEFALNYFKIKAPVFTDDVRVRVYARLQSRKFGCFGWQKAERHYNNGGYYILIYGNL